jgi:uncharacterized protein (TIGR02246 family)
MPAQTPEQCDELFGQYVNAHDLDKLTGLYEGQATLVNEDGTVAAGAAAIREAFKGYFDALPEGKINMNVVKIIKTGNLAIVYNDWNMSGKAADGSSFNMQHKAIEVVRRQADGSWRFAIDDPYARSRRAYDH